MEKVKLVCRSPWCKATFLYQPIEVNGNLIEEPKYCPKCISFDTELSGGVTWTDKKYNESRFDGKSHKISLNVSKYTDKKY